MADIKGIELVSDIYGLEDTQGRIATQTAQNTATAASNKADSNETAIEAIQNLIPSTASSSNKLTVKDEVLPNSAYSKLANKVLIAQDSWRNGDTHTVNFSATESSKYTFLFVEVITDWGWTETILTADGGGFFSPTPLSPTRRIDIASNAVAVSNYAWSSEYTDNKIAVYGVLPKSLT